METWRVPGIAVHLDDNPLVLADLGAAIPALIDTPYNRAQPRQDRVRVVEHWRAFEALVATLAAEVARAPGEAPSLRSVRRM